jgi:hypothetical protein
VGLLVFGSPLPDFRSNGDQSSGATGMIVFGVADITREKGYYHVLYVSRPNLP